MEVLAESSLIIKIKNKNVLKWLTYYVHRKLLRGRGSSKYYHGYIEGGWGYKGPKNVLRSMWLIPKKKMISWCVDDDLDIIGFVVNKN